jgi:hypothetical protein
MSPAREQNTHLWRCINDEKAGLWLAFPNGAKKLTAAPLGASWLYSDTFGPFFTPILDEGSADGKPSQPEARIESNVLKLQIRSGKFGATNDPSSPPILRQGSG